MSYPHLQKRRMELWKQGTITIGRHQVAFSLISHERFGLVHCSPESPRTRIFTFFKLSAAIPLQYCRPRPPNTEIVNLERNIE